MPNENKQDTVKNLTNLLADSYSLYLKTQNYHWNVVGPMFNSLHVLFQQQYEELSLAVDEIAERIRIIGAPTPGSFTAFQKYSSIEEENAYPKALEMIQKLSNDQDLLVQSAHELLKVAEKANDQPSIDLAIRRIEIHQKNKWMLHAHLE